MARAWLSESNSVFCLVKALALAFLMDAFIFPYVLLEKPSVYDYFLLEKRGYSLASFPDGRQWLLRQWAEPGPGRYSPPSRDIK